MGKYVQNLHGYKHNTLMEQSDNRPKETDYMSASNFQSYVLPGCIVYVCLPTDYETGVDINVNVLYM